MRALHPLVVFVTLLPLSCQVYEPAPYPGFHLAFPIQGGHTTVACEACHEGGAQQQQLTPDVPGTRWTTKLRQTCNDCHPYTANVDLAQPCAADDQREHCRYEAVDIKAVALGLIPIHEPNRLQSCGAGGSCHTSTHLTWDQVAGGGEDNPHSDPPLVNTFPIEGPHGQLLCISCHPDATNPQAQRGGSTFCATCHTRADEEAPPSGGGTYHYPPARAEWIDSARGEMERDCKACHTRETAAGKLILPTDWAQNAYEHKFLTPHQTVVDWDFDRTLQPESAWVIGCAECHQPPGSTAGGSYTSRYCISCHPLGEAFNSLWFAHATVSHSNDCTNSGCHISGATNQDF